MICVYCGAKSLKTTNSRPTHQNHQVWRRRHCQRCDKVFTTYEKPNLSYIEVVQSDSKPKHKLEYYSRAKLTQSLLGCFNDPTKYQQVDDLADTIEIKLVNLQQASLRAETIADIVLQTLKPVDTAAFMQYLSQHKSPSGPAELSRLIRQY